MIVAEKAETASSMATIPPKKKPAFPDEQWAELIMKMVGGDQEALGELYDQSNRLVFSFVLRIVSDHGAAEEITLDTYHQIWRQAANFDSERGRPSSWMLTIARSRAIDRLRSTASARKAQAPLEDSAFFPAGTDSPEAYTVLGEEQRRVRAALAQLKPEQRELIEIAFFGGLTHHEIAAQFNLPLGTVKTRIRTGMMQLRKLLSV